MRYNIKKKGMIKMKKMSFLVIMILSFCLLTSCKNNGDNSPSNEKQDKINEYGNLSVNISNGGEIAFQDGWYYYNNGKGIYKSKEDGTEREQVTLEDGGSLNVVGEWIYFITHGGIRKIKTDGTEYTFVSSIGGNGLIVAGEWIYFYDIGEGLYKVKTDGTEQQKLVSGWAPTQINIDENYIYYSFSGYSNDNDNGIYRIKTDGTDNTLIYAPEKLSFVSDIKPIVLKDKWLYFFRYFNDSNGVKALCRIKTDGSKVENVYNFENEHEYFNEFNILYDKFFWTSDIITNDGLDIYSKGYKVSLDGKNKEEIESTIIYKYALNEKYIKKMEEGENIKFEIYDDKDNKISTLE